MVYFRNENHLTYSLIVLFLQGVEPQCLKLLRSRGCSKVPPERTTKPLTCIIQCLEQGQDHCQHVQWDSLNRKCYRDEGIASSDSECITMKRDFCSFPDVTCMEPAREFVQQEGFPLKGFKTPWECKAFCNVLMDCKAFSYNKHQSLCTIYVNELTNLNHDIPRGLVIERKKPECYSEVRCLTMRLGANAFGGMEESQANSLMKCLDVLKSEDIDKVDWDTSFALCFSHKHNDDNPTKASVNSLLQIQKRKGCRHSKHIACSVKVDSKHADGGYLLGRGLCEKECTEICESVSNCFGVGWHRKTGACKIHLISIQWKKSSLSGWNFYSLSPCRHLVPKRDIVFQDTGIQLCQMRCAVRPGCRGISFDAVSLNCHLHFEGEMTKVFKDRLFYPRIESRLASELLERKACLHNTLCFRRIKGKAVCVKDPRRKGLDVD